MGRRNYTVVMLEIPVHQYFVFHAGLRPDPRLPPTYAEWMELSLREENYYKAIGMKTRRMTIDWDDFLDHALGFSGPLTLSLVQVYANQLRRKQVVRRKVAA